MESAINIILGIIFFFLPILLLMWVYNDAEEQGHGGCLWVLIVLVFSWVGLSVYLVFFHGLAAPQRKSGPRRDEDLQYRSMYRTPPASSNGKLPSQWGQTSEMKTTLSADPDFSDENLDRLINAGKLSEARVYLRDMVSMAKEMGDRKGMANYTTYEARISRASGSGLNRPGVSRF